MLGTWTCCYVSDSFDSAAHVRLTVLHDPRCMKQIGRFPITLPN